MIPYHGGPVSGPAHVAQHLWSRRHAFVSWWRPDQVEIAAGVSQSWALDCGAYSAWRSGSPVTDWSPYYAWCEKWLAHPACDWAIIPDVIDGSAQDNDALIEAWPHGDRGVPVWHLHEPPERLEWLASAWPRVALGSSAAYDARRPRQCIERLARVLPRICDADGRPLVKLHGLRMLAPAIASVIPLASADSTTAARNCGLDSRWRGTYAPPSQTCRVDVLADRLEATITPSTLDVAALKVSTQGTIWEDVELVELQSNDLRERVAHLRYQVEEVHTDA